MTIKICSPLLTTSRFDQSHLNGWETFCFAAFFSNWNNICFNIWVALITIPKIERKSLEQNVIKRCYEWNQKFSVSSIALGNWFAKMFWGIWISCKLTSGCRSIFWPLGSATNQVTTLVDVIPATTSKLKIKANTSSFTRHQYGNKVFKKLFMASKGRCQKINTSKN